MSLLCRGLCLCSPWTFLHSPVEPKWPILLPHTWQPPLPLHSTVHSQGTGQKEGKSHRASCINV